MLRSLVIAVVALVGLRGEGATQASAKCEGPDFRAFDFWVGSWEVTMKGQPAGTNEVTLEEDGCVVHEHWKGARGGTGQSLNFYNRTTGKWHQVWVDNSGTVANLAGDVRDGNLYFVGAAKRNGADAITHLTFFKNPDGTVRQVWESSTDRGATWAVMFDGLYRRK